MADSVCIGKTCSVEGCDRPFASRELCARHYSRWKRHGDPLAGRAPRKRPHVIQACSVKGCNAPQSCKGFCKKHYSRWKRHGDPLGGKGDPLMLTPEWLEQNIKECAETECVLWPFALDRDGYGMITLNGRSLRAHRVALEIHTGETGEVTRHKCRNRNCVNPHHLEWGTVLENNRDKYRDGTVLLGSDAPNSKLTKDQVRAIRDDPRDTRDIASDFGISRGHVFKLKRKDDVWSWLD